MGGLGSSTTSDNGSEEFGSVLPAESVAVKPAGREVIHAAMGEEGLTEVLQMRDTLITQIFKEPLVRYAQLDVTLKEEMQTMLNGEPLPDRILTDEDAFRQIVRQHMRLPG